MTETDTTRAGEPKDPDGWTVEMMLDCVRIAQRNLERMTAGNYMHQRGVVKGALNDLEHFIRSWGLPSPLEDEERAALTRELAETRAEQRRDALDGQAALDEANNEVVRLRSWLEHIRDEVGDEADSGAFARDMATRALAPAPEEKHDH